MKLTLGVPCNRAEEDEALECEEDARVEGVDAPAPVRMLQLRTMRFCGVEAGLGGLLLDAMLHILKGAIDAS